MTVGVNHLGFALRACSKSLWGRFSTGLAAEKHEARPVGNRPHRLLEQTLRAPEKCFTRRAQPGFLCSL